MPLGFRDPIRMRTFKPDSRFSRLTMEFFVIVAGVLAALAVDQWRESRQELGFERELLHSLSFDVATDSTDFAILPRRALGRALAAETLLREFRPDAPRGVDALVALDTLGPFPAASDSALVEALAVLVIMSDLDVASGAYTEFSAGGGQRLIRNRELRRRIHEYHYYIEANLKYDPVVFAAIDETNRRAHDIGLSAGDADASSIRRRLAAPDADAFFAAVRTLQAVSVVQNDIGWLMINRARSLLKAIHSELGATS